MKITDISPAIALSPLDGRYHSQTTPLVEYLSEAALNRERMRVEVEWMILLANGFNGTGDEDAPRTPIINGVKAFTQAEIDYLRAIPEDFGAEGIAELAEIEATTRHDVKAVEYYIDRRLDSAAEELGEQSELPRLKPLVHFACTSEDINNLSYARCIKNAVEQVWTPGVQTIVDLLDSKAEQYRDLAMLSLTHGQPATPTTLGKELAVYVFRLNRQLRKVTGQEYLGKINGATGTFGAHIAAYPNVDWVAVSREFVSKRMGLTWNPLTTQIESHDWQAELYSTIGHVNRILHNLAVDVWMYISRGVFAQEAVKGATGSSTMPHKVNPIRFENAEANLEISCSLLDTLAATLVESRWQRDLTDSTTQRNIGSALGYSVLALNNLLGGLQSIHPNETLIEEELDGNWEVLGEPIQTAMRAEALLGKSGMDNPYEQVKELMRGHHIGQDDVQRFIDSLNYDPETAKRLRELTPATYTGIANGLVDFARR
ncbi:MAG: adenylosuccinate lyase [Bifidobacterium psychraerophilum]|uniref:adenylosuccinate lyase n=1 Tax=Bifidobacterium psychraerophilum TaxID=218140 RepID=UPI0039E8833C